MGIEKVFYKKVLRNFTLLQQFQYISFLEVYFSPERYGSLNKIHTATLLRTYGMLPRLLWLTFYFPSFLPLMM